MENQNAIIFIGRAAYAGRGRLAEGSLDAANILKACLSRGESSASAPPTPRRNTASQSKRTARSSAASRP